MIGVLDSPNKESVMQKVHVMRHRVIHVDTRRNYNLIIWYNIATSFWCNNDVIIAPFVC